MTTATWREGGGLRLLPLCISVVLPAILALAALGKVMDWPAFERSVEGFSLLPRVLRQYGPPVVPLLESAGMALLLLGRPRAANVWSAGVVCGFTVLVLFHWFNNIEPGCSCLGQWQRYFDIESTSWGIVRRNLVLMAIGIVSAFLIRSGARAADGTAGATA